MGATLQWRNEPVGRVDRSFGATVRFGSGRDAGTGYLAYSDRVGPGVVILHDGTGLEPWCTQLADALNDDGFTVLVPDLLAGAEPSPDPARLPDDVAPDDAVRRAGAALDHLVDNWHPRAGVVGFGPGAELAVRLAGGRDVDALVLYSGVADLPDVPVAGHYPGADANLASRAEAVFARAAARGSEVELYVYEGAPRDWPNPRAGDPVGDAALSLERTTELFHYHLS